MNVEFYDCNGRAGVFYGNGCIKDVTRLEPNTSEGASEKHLPGVENTGSEIVVRAGSVEHPSTREHFIGLIALQTDKAFHAAEIEPEKPPVARFAVRDEKPIAAYAYCNLHGVWKTEL